MIKLSAGTAHVLGLKKLTTDAPPSTAYLMQGKKCTHDCGFCPQARTASSRADLLSRITWGEAEEGEVARGVGTAYRTGQLKRVCLQVVDGRHVLEQVKDTVAKLKGYSNIPICVSAKVKNKEELLALAESGVERIGLALDAASARVFNATKSGSWEKNFEQIQEAAQLLPGRISTHLIVGLGETEEEMVNMLQMIRDLGVTVGLFAFTPVAGTRMAEIKPPALEHYRRMQAAHYLIRRGLIKAADCTYSSGGSVFFSSTGYSGNSGISGRLCSFGLSTDQLREYLQDGKAFETSGCPDCNRPYYNERPGGIIYNYPRPLHPEEIQTALQMVVQSLPGVLFTRK